MKQQGFKEFWALLRQMPGADEGIKCMLVFKFTGARTDSLREMRKDEYRRMIEHMRILTGSVRLKRNKGNYTEEAEMWRKRAIAAVFGFYKKIHEDVSIAYVKAIICRSAQERDINKISVAKLREIYNVWTIKQRIKNNVDNVVTEELKKFDYL